MKRFVSLSLLITGLAVATVTSYAGPAPARPLAASDLGGPGRILSLQGLSSGGSRTAGLALANLSSSSAQCSVSLEDAGGKALGEVAVTLAPRAHRYLGDLFAGREEISGARAEVSCDRSFYAFAVIPDQETGGVAVVDPTPIVEAETVTPCASAAGPRIVCYDAMGIVHQPTPATPVKRVSFPVPVGTYGRIKMSLDVTVGPFYKPDPDAKHLIYWFVLNKNIDMMGMLYFRGPDTYTALSRYGIGLTHPQKIKLVKPFRAVPGHTYRCENDLDMAKGTITITVTDTASGEKVVLSGRANVRQLTTKTNDRLIVDMAFPEGKVPDEVPAYGWTFKDVHVEAVPK